MKQGLPFHRNDESASLKNKRKFVELLQFLCDYNEDVRRVALDNAPKNAKLIAPCIQKNIVRACAYHTTKYTIVEFDGAFVFIHYGMFQ